MAHSHPVVDNDPMFIIDPSSRTITKETSSTKNQLMQYDHNSEIFRFKIPSEIEGHPVSNCDIRQIHYINTGTGTSVSNRETRPGIYEIPKFTSDIDDPNYMYFDWLISQNATQLVGDLKFQIKLGCMNPYEPGEIDYMWSSQVYSAVEILPGINNTEIVVTEYTDILEQWKAEIDRSLADMDAKIDSIEGEKGVDGKDGVSPTVEVTEIIDGHRLTITDANGAKTVDVLDGDDGKDGTSVTVSSVSESTADSGNNVITFSDGKTITIKNGSKGSTGADGAKGDTGTKGDKGDKGDTGETGRDGADGKDGYTPVKGVDYWTDADKEEIKTEDIIFISTELAKRGQLKPEFANSIEECTDTTKLYVLPDGFIYAYMTKAEIIEHKGENKFIASEATLNKRMGSSSLSDANGYVWTGAIPVDLTKESPFRIKVEGTQIVECTTEHQKLWLCADNTGTTKLSAAVMLFGAAATSSYGVLFEDGTIHADYKAGVKLSDSIITGTKYIRIGFKFSDSAISSTSELSDVSITFPHETYTEEIVTNSWHNTGHAFVPADYENRIIDLEHKIDDFYNKSNGNEITVPNFWESAVNSCISKIKALQSGRDCVTFAFFSDNHQNTKYVGSLIGKVMQDCHIPYCFFGGDAIDSGTLANESAMIANDKAFDDSMSIIPVNQMCRAVGNHDGYWVDKSDVKHRYTRSQIYDLFLRQETIAQTKHYGGDGTYYYVDDLASETRFVVCNTNYNFNTATETLDSQQLAWLNDVVFKDSDKSLKLVFISHQPITNNHHSNIYADTAHAIQQLLTNKINAGWNVVGWFSGHIHADRIYQTDHTTNTEANDQSTVTLPWKTVTIRADHTGLCRDEDLIHTPADDNLSHAIDFVTINKSTRIVNLTRLGIGDDRNFTY
jgi:hypothetical protein